MASEMPTSREFSRLVADVEAAAVCARITSSKGSWRHTLTDKEMLDIWIGLRCDFSYFSDAMDRLNSAMPHHIGEESEDEDDQ